jgi:hypothetical protein
MADYPISNVPRRVQYVNSGVGPYAFTFEILIQTDIAVYRGNTLLTLTTDYTVAINANGTGSITLTTAGTGNITIVGARAIQRSSDYTTGGDLFASTLNTDLDSQTIYSQQLAESLDRTLKAPVTDASTINLGLPVASLRANKVFAFDSTGAPQVSTNTLAAIDAAVDTIESLASAAPGSSAGVSYISDGTGAVATTVQAKLRETVSVTDFGAIGDWSGSAGTDNLTAFNNAITHLKSLGGGLLIIPEGAYWLNGIWDISGDRSITIEAFGAVRDLDVETLTNQSRIVFTSASHCIRIDDSRGLQMSGVTVDCSGVANNGFVVRRMNHAVWQNITVYRNQSAGYRFEGDPTFSNLDQGNVGNTFIQLQCRGVRGIELVGVIGGSWHNNWINTKIDYTGNEGILLEQCDNNSFYQTFAYRRSGSGPGVRWSYPGSGLGPNSIFFYHLQGEIVIGANVLYPGAVYGFDQSNGQSFPTIPNDIEFAITTNGLNAKGWMVQKNAATRSISVSGANVGWAWQDDFNYGHMLWNNVNANAFIWRLNSTSRRLEMSVDPDGTGDQLAMEVGAAGPVIPTNKKINFIDSASTVGAAGGASALPATPSGYILIKVNGTDFKVPYYAV